MTECKCGKEIMEDDIVCEDENFGMIGYICKSCGHSLCKESFRKDCPDHDCDLRGVINE